jgi:hypothetical protein
MVGNVTACQAVNVYEGKVAHFVLEGPAGTFPADTDVAMTLADAGSNYAWSGRGTAGDKGQRLSVRLVCGPVGKPVQRAAGFGDLTITVTSPYMKINLPKVDYVVDNLPC